MFNAPARAGVVADGETLYVQTIASAIRTVNRAESSARSSIWHGTNYDLVVRQAEFKHMKEFAHDPRLHEGRQVRGCHVHASNALQLDSTATSSPHVITRTCDRGSSILPHAPWKR
jgi:hypothetical protein